MSEMAKSIITGVAVSVAVSSFAVSMSFGTLTESLASANADIEMLKGVRMEHTKELNRREVVYSQIDARVDALEEKEVEMNRAVICILSVNPNDKNAQTERLRCIGESNRSRRMLHVISDIHDD